MGHTPVARGDRDESSVRGILRGCLAQMHAIRGPGPGESALHGRQAVAPQTPAGEYVLPPQALQTPPTAAEPGAHATQAPPPDLTVPLGQGAEGGPDTPRK
jgi:hypothetical protein